MNKRRLLKLAALLEADAKNEKGVKFDLERWGDVRACGAFETPKKIEINCNTTACAVGLACISGVFKRSGLSYLTQPQIIDGNNFIPTYRGYKNFYAVEAFFELDHLDAHFLFVDEEYPERKRTGAKGELAVAKRIRDFVASAAD